MKKLDVKAFRKNTRSRLEKILSQNIKPFWYPGAIDRENGGYYLNHDVYGRPLGEGAKMIVTQARMVWYFSRLFNSGWGGSESLEAARHGYVFLRDKMWDPDNGGFFWEVDHRGNLTIPGKNMYGQAFGLYALSEFAMASKDDEALSIARTLFNLIEEHSHDDSYGGYRESFLKDWSPSSGSGPLGEDFSKIKSMNTHLHMLEALDNFYRATGDKKARERLVELILILSNSIVRKDAGVCTEAFQLDWTPLHGPRHDRTSYGHNLENIWLLINTCNLLKIPHSLLLDFYRTLFHFTARFGFDYENGGFYDSGPLNRPADRIDKVWWVQAEALVCEVYMYRLTNDPAYLDFFEKTLNWVEEKQVDWKNGDWYNVIRPDGKPFGYKAGPWKAAYHNGRAMMEIIALLDKMDEDST